MPHSSVEAGERALPDPGERRGCRVVDQTPDRAEDVEPPSVSLKANGPCEGQRHNVTSRVHLTCTPGSVGDLGGRPPRSTRPQETPRMSVLACPNAGMVQRLSWPG